MGDEYDAVVPILWIFALTGSALSILQVGLLAAIAHDRTWVGFLSWLVLAAEVIIILVWAHSITTLAVSAAGCAIVGTLLTFAALNTKHRSKSSRTVDA